MTAFYLGGAFCFVLAGLVVGFVLGLMKGHALWAGDDDDPPAPSPQPPHEGGPASDLDCLDHFDGIHEFVGLDEHNVIRIL